MQLTKASDQLKTSNFNLHFIGASEAAMFVCLFLKQNELKNVVVFNKITSLE